MDDVKGPAEGFCGQFQSWLHVLEITDDIDFNGSLEKWGRRRIFDFCNVHLHW